MYSQDPAINGYTACSYKGPGMLFAGGAFGDSGAGPFFCPTAMISIPERRPGGMQCPTWPPLLLGGPGGDLYDRTTGESHQDDPRGRKLFEQALDPEGRPDVDVGGISPGAAGKQDRHQPVGECLCPRRSTVLQERSTSPPRWSSMSPTVGSAVGPAISGRCPRPQNLRSGTAILADLVGGKAYVDLIHKDGINVLRVDGSAAWVPRGIIDSNLSNSALPWNPAGEPSWSISADLNPTSGSEHDQALGSTRPELIGTGILTFCGTE